MIRFRTHLIVALTVCATGAHAQTVEVPASEGGTTTINVDPGASTSTESTTVYTPPGALPPGTDVNSHLPSSSKARLDINEGDSFDLAPRRGGSVSLRGGKNAPALVGGGVSGATRIPGIHRVRKGDTLWDLCNHYYRNPWMWPKVWSFNPQLQNPHWIYPGDQLRMKRNGLEAVAREAGFMSSNSIVPANTVFLRNQGYIDDPKRDAWGEVLGAREDQMLLAYGNNIYMSIRKGADVRLGQLLTVFTTVRKPKKIKGTRRPPGEIVAFKGTVKVTEWNRKTRVARGRIVESLDVIERGFKVGPIGRRFDVVPPKRATKTLWARILTSVYPHVYMAQNQVVFLDRGREDGLKPGYKMFVVRKGDVWRQSLKTATRSARDRVRQDVDEQVRVEDTPLKGDQKDFPEEIIGELRVLRTRKYSSIAIVTASHREFTRGDRAIARKGY